MTTFDRDMQDSGGSSPFHEGELSIQDRLGVRSKLDKAARRGIRDYMPDQHREFFAQLPFLVVGTLSRDSRDETCQPWASILVNRPGFVSSPTSRQLQVSATTFKGDPFGDNLQIGAPIGVLGIEPHSRRRNRANGIVDQVFDSGFSIQISQSFGNCPKYIQARRLLGNSVETLALDPPKVIRATTLDDRMQAIIGNADTFFIASSYPQNKAAADNTRDNSHGVDVSHRGGKPGFVQWDGVRNQLTVPDYFGNFFFNTLGNLILNPRAGLLFPDFESGDLLYLAVETNIIWEGPELESFDNAQRLLQMQVREAVRVESALPWHWSAPEFSPHLD